MFFMVCSTIIQCLRESSNDVGNKIVPYSIQDPD